MNKPDAESIARLLEQCHRVFGFAAHALLPANREKTVQTILNELDGDGAYAGVVFGFMGLAFVLSYDGVFKKLNKPATIANETDPSLLGATINHVAGGENANEACLRHLRNCFAHNQYELSGTGTSMAIRLVDKNNKGNTTFEASCDIELVSNIAERVLVAAHSEAAKLVSPTLPTQSGT